MASESTPRKFFRDLAIWAASLAVELVLRKLLMQFGAEVGFSEDWIAAGHRLMSIALWVTLMSTLAFTAAEVVSIGLRRLLRELTLLVRQFRGFLGAFSRRK